YHYMSDVVRTKDASLTFTLLGTVVLLGATVTGLIGGSLSDRWGRKRIVFLAGVTMAFAALAFAAVTLPGSVPLVVVFPLAIFWGLGYGSYISVDWALGTDVLPSLDDAGKDMGVWHLSMVLPQTIAPPLAGYILHSFPADPN